MRTKLFITAALLCCFTICLAAVMGIAGGWTGSIKMDDGNDLPLTYTFKTDSGKLTGTAESPQGTINIIEGKLNGDDFSFGVMVNDVKVLHTAKYISTGDSISLNIDFNGQKFHTTLKRNGK